MQNQFGKTHTRSRKAECKTKKAVIQPQRFDHIMAAYAYALWVGDPANEYLGREERVQGWVIVSHTTPARIVADTSNGFGETKNQTWYRNGRPMGGSGNCLLRVATIHEIVEWEIARPEERRVRKAEEQKRKAEKEALPSLVPEGVVLSKYGDRYLLTGLTREQAEVAGAALKAIVS
jgi:hypothetical protein